jgi:hypothetical protein
VTPVTVLLAVLGAVPAHLGAVHGVERVLVAVTALAPFVVLAVVAVVARRRQARDDEADGPG